MLVIPVAGKRAFFLSCIRIISSLECKDAKGLLISSFYAFCFSFLLIYAL